MASGSPRSRRVGVAVDFSECSVNALKWTVDNVLREGDHLIIVVAHPPQLYERGEMQLWEATGSPFLTLVDFTNAEIMKKYALKPGPDTIAVATSAAKEKKVEVLMKVFWGDAREKICEAIGNIPLDYLVIGNRGLGPLRRAIMGSVSNYVVNHASCPVTVVKSIHHS